MRTFSLQSGSNGNCIYVEAGDVKLLFDAGISGRQARLRMAEHGRDIRDVDALILTHAHGDHTRGAGVFQRLFHLPIHTTPATQRVMAPFVGKLNDVRHFHPGDTMHFDGVAVHSIATPHDAAESVAFVVEHEGRRLGIFTDLGHPFGALARALVNVHAAYLESNYDFGMLMAGDYPPELKARIRGMAGHISNDEAALLLSRCAPRPTWIALAHLSQHNNEPELALATHRRQLGRQYPLHIASRYGVSDVFEV